MLDKVVIVSFALLVLAATAAQGGGAGADEVWEWPMAPTVNRYWYDRTEAIATRYSLGDVFVRQIMQESGYEDDVISGQRVSWAGAEGIAQIMRSHHPYADPLNPEKALRYAATHMLDLLVYFDGSVAKALAAYNAGAGTVDWAVAVAGDGWLSQMPEETQHYISVIMLPSDWRGLRGWPGIKRWWDSASDTLKFPYERETWLATPPAAVSQP